MSAFSPSLSLCRAPLSIVWPHVIARMKSRRSYAWNAFILWFFTNALAFAIRDNSTQLFSWYSRSELPKYNRVNSLSLPHFGPVLASQHVWARVFFSTWVKFVTVVSVMASWQLRNVRDGHHECVTLTGVTQAKFVYTQWNSSWSLSLDNDLQQEPMLTEPCIAAMLA